MERGPELSKALEFTLVRKKKWSLRMSESRLVIWSISQYTTSSGSNIEKYDAKSK